ncbi:MAG: hypothetical protein QOH06_2607 [Acidobacteriota bacterium]|jgi:hypothetical protein|nr:hypothetical protein [Acidobacteriota bacterium]
MSRYVTARHWESDESDYTELRELLTPELAELPAEQLEAMLESAFGGSAEDLENFWKGFKKFGRAAGGVLVKALPVAATVAGTAFGGPVGAAIGGAAGQALSGALGGALSGPNRGRGGRVLQGLAGGAMSGVAGIAGGLAGGGAPGRGLPGPFGAIAGAAGPALAGLAGGGSPSAAQLMRTITRPETLQALLSMTMGGAGRRQVPVGGTPVPAGAFANLLGVLANQAAAEYHQTIAGESAGTPMYLLDGAGEFVGDPADPASRAEVLMLRLAEADALEAAESAEAYDDAYDEAYDESDEQWELAELEAESDEYDEYDLADAYEED